MPTRKRTLLLCGAGLLARIAPARGLVPPLYDIAADDLRRALGSGATLVGTLDERLFVERYEPGGRLRGTYAGRAYEGRWRLDGPRLCTEVASEPPLCVTVKGSAEGPMTEGLDLTLLPGGRRPSLRATYHARAPWLTRSPAMSVQVRALSPGKDYVSVLGSVEGLPRFFMVWTGRPLSPDRTQDVLIHGTTDGVTFTAERVTRPDGSPLP